MIPKQFIRLMITRKEQDALRKIMSSVFFLFILTRLEQEEIDNVTSFIEKLSNEVHKMDWCENPDCKLQHKN